ncbi:MAG TPA: flagellar filament capping protein FliD [Terriglobales bacterium]|jgi:flagellar hook-associated protein 2|nr:flagellar filament capping protein FliD [Terriglobales bacterium]
MVSLNPSTLLNGSGIDVASLVSQVLSAQSGGLQLLQQQQTDLQTKANLLTGFNGDLSSLSSAVNVLTDVLGPLSSVSAQSSQTSILTASAQPSALPGTHTLVVSTLASQSTLYTDSVADANTSILPQNAASADIKFQLGGPSGPTRDIPISAGSNDTLNSLVSYINSQNWGVTASVLSDASGARLAIYANSPGSTGALAITNNSSSLTFNPAVGGTDANFTVDGIPFSSTSNTVAGAIPGVTLNLLGAYPGVQVQVSVASDSNQIAQAVTGFVSAYNAVIADINQQFTVNAGTNAEGPLGGDSSLRSLQSSLLSDATYSLSSGTFISLDSLGITTNDDGRLSVNASQLNSAISSDPASVLNFFQNSTATGFANNFAKDLQNLTDPTRGVISLDLNENRTRQQELTNSISDIQDRLTAEQQQLQTQFSRVNALLQAFPSQLRAIQLELGIAPSSSGNSTAGG